MRWIRQRFEVEFVEEEEEEDDCGTEFLQIFSIFFLNFPVQIPSPFIADLNRLQSVEAVADSSTLAICYNAFNRFLFSRHCRLKIPFSQLPERPR